MTNYSVFVISQSLSYVFCNFNMLFSFSLIFCHLFQLLFLQINIIKSLIWFVISIDMLLLAAEFYCKCCLCFSCCVKTERVCSSVWAFVLAVLWATVKKTIVEQLQSFFLSYLAFCQFNLTCGVAVFCFDCLFFDKIQTCVVQLFDFQ